MRRNIHNGFVAITSVLVIAAIVVSIIISTTILGVGEAKNSLSFKKGREALASAHGCIEEALLRIRNSSTYSGTASPLILGDSSCTIAVAGTGSDREINVVAEIAGPPRYVKKVSATIKREGNSVTVIAVNEVE